MKHILLLFTTIALAACSPKSDSIVVYFENDVHCNIEAYPTIHQMAQLTADTAWVAVVSSGDFLNGTHLVWPLNLPRGITNPNHAKSCG